MKMKHYLGALCMLFAWVSEAQITSVSPSQGNRGQTLPVIISGNFSQQATATEITFRQGSMVMYGNSTYQGTTTALRNIQFNATTIVADMQIPGYVPTGMYDLQIDQSDGQTTTTSLHLQSFLVGQGTSTNVNMVAGGGKPGQTVTETFTWDNLDLSSETMSMMWLSLNGEVITTLTNFSIVQKNGSSVQVDIVIPPSATPGYWSVGMELQSGQVYYSPGVFHIDSRFSVAELNRDLDLVLYPNPTQSTLHLNMPTYNKAKVTLRIVDMTGREVHHDTHVLTDHELSIDVSAYAPGVYFLQQIENGTVVSTEQWIRE